MGVRIKQYNTNAPDAASNNATEFLDDTLEQRTVLDSEGYQYIMGPNEMRNFLDDGRGIAAAASANGDNIVQDAIPFGSALS